MNRDCSLIFKRFEVDRICKSRYFDIIDSGIIKCNMKGIAVCNGVSGGGGGGVK